MVCVTEDMFSSDDGATKLVCTRFHLLGVVKLHCKNCGLGLLCGFVGDSWCEKNTDVTVSVSGLDHVRQPATVEVTRRHLCLPNFLLYSDDWTTISWLLRYFRLVWPAAKHCLDESHGYKCNHMTTQCGHCIEGNGQASFSKFTSILIR